MDSVRFGRALGAGAREVAKALVKAADAATSPNPSQTAKPATPPAPSATRPAPQVIQKAVRASAQATHISRGVREGSRRFGQAVWEPTARLTGVLWLEVTGVFFALFAFVGAGFCWKHWLELRYGSTPERQRFVMMAAMALLFGYFCISSFVRAHRRARR